MDTKTVDALLEKMVLEADLGELPPNAGDPNSGHPRFNWKPGQPRKFTPPRIDPSKHHVVGSTRPPLRPAKPVTPMDTGSLSMRDMLPQDQMASKDDLIDLGLQIKSTHDPVKKAQLQAQYDSLAGQLESRVAQFVDALLS